MINFTINGKNISVEPGTTIIEAADQNGIFIPRYCYHPALTKAGSCRLCLVEVEGMPREVIACATPVTEAMVVLTESEKVKRSRQIVLEFLLLNHPLDCPTCDKAGECSLQDFSFDYGNSHSRYKEEKRVPPFKGLGPNIQLATTRCILCTRCIRFMEEVAGDTQLGLVHRGSHNEIAVGENKELDHILAGNVTDICPVGALLDKNFIHRTRVWHLENNKAVCGECSSGCNVYIDSYEDSIFRIKPRYNENVNGHWICDTGRYAYKKYNDLERLSIPKIKENGKYSDSAWDDALKAVRDNFGKFQKTKGAVAGLVSGSTLNEDAFALKEFLKTFNSSSISGIFQPHAEDDQKFKSGFVIKGDKLPNQEGLKFVFELNGPDLFGETILTKIESGEVKAVYIIHNDLSDIPERTMEALKRLKFLAVEDIVWSPLAEMADVVLPGFTYMEKNGTFVNYQKRLQLHERAVAGPEGSKNTWDILRRIAGSGANQLQWFSSSDIFLKMSKKYPVLNDLSHFKLNDKGILISENKDRN
ncbi:molybdopterin-dependent oxidoreductase [candidate division KSB1 bacterium]